MKARTYYRLLRFFHWLHDMTGSWLIWHSGRNWERVKKIDGQPQ